MKFKPGHVKAGGRTKGTPNKRTALLSDALESLKLNVPERLVSLLPQLEPEKQADVLLDLMGYLFPKRKALETEETPVSPPSDEEETLDKASDAQLLEIVRNGKK